jgi:hypothetical protein
MDIRMTLGIASILHLLMNGTTDIKQLHFYKNL